MIYLASPYSHPQPAVRHERYMAASKALNLLLNQRQWTFSPIVHCHDNAVRFGLPTTHDFWLEFDTAFLRRCEFLYVLAIAGWRESKGVAVELSLAGRLHLPISYMSFDERSPRGFKLYNKPENIGG